MPPLARSSFLRLAMALDGKLSQCRARQFSLGTPDRARDFFPPFMPLHLLFSLRFAAAYIYKRIGSIEAAEPPRGPTASIHLWLAEGRRHSIALDCKSFVACVRLSGRCWSPDDDATPIGSVTAPVRFALVRVRPKGDGASIRWNVARGRGNNAQQLAGLMDSLSRAAVTRIPKQHFAVRASSFRAVLCCNEFFSDR